MRRFFLLDYLIRKRLWGLCGPQTDAIMTGSSYKPAGGRGKSSDAKSWYQKFCCLKKKFFFCPIFSAATAFAVCSNVCSNVCSRMGSVEV